MSLIADSTDFGKVTVGCPPPPSSLGLNSEEWTSFQFHFINFDYLKTGDPDAEASRIQSPEFTCNGHRWKLGLTPSGCNNGTKGSLSVQHLSEENIIAPFKVDIMDRFGKSRMDFRNCIISKHHNESWELISYSDILDDNTNILDSNGNLNIVVSIAQDPTTACVPQNPFIKMMKEMFNDETTADVCFEVVRCADTKEGKDKKMLKTSDPFYAHRVILRKCAPMLADLFGSYNKASITDTKPVIFRHLLYYIYGGQVAEEDLKAHAKEIIDAADKYSIVNLKLAAEAAYVESTEITFDNAIDDLLYADSKNCALLKEKVMQFLADHHYEAAEKISRFSDCPGHVMKDLLIAVGRKCSDGWDSDDDVDELTTLRVSELRWKLVELGLEVDGSRESMIESITSHYTS